jgi:hypothetical protein
MATTLTGDLKRLAQAANSGVRSAIQASRQRQTTRADELAAIRRVLRDYLNAMVREGMGGGLALPNDNAVSTLIGRKAVDAAALFFGSTDDGNLHHDVEWAMLVFEPAYLGHIKASVFMHTDDATEPRKEHSLGRVDGQPVAEVLKKFFALMSERWPSDLRDDQS